MEQVILARHGESEFSLVGTVNGDPGTACALTDAGEAQARRLGELLRDTPIDLCVTSEFQRVRQTADVALAGREVARLVMPDLNDVRFGSFEGGTLAAYREWAAANDPTKEAPGGGESRSGTIGRYVRAYRAILERPERTIFAVTHGLPIRYVLNALGDLEPAPLVEQVPYAEPYEVDAAALTRVVERLEAWLTQPVWASEPPPTLS
jgi:broad specificity phosphatase PhoE